MRSCPTVGYSGSGDIITQTVDAAGVDVGLTSSDASSDYGQSVTFTATITSQQVGTGAPSGYAQFVLDGTPLGDAVELDGNGVATSQAVANLLPGDHEVRALYSGDAYFVSGASSITQAVAKVATTTSLTATPTSSTYGQTVALSATVTPAVATAGTPGGTVTFKRGTTTIATVPVAAGPGSSAIATANVSNLAAGQPLDPGGVLGHAGVRGQRIDADDGHRSPSRRRRCRRTRRWSGCGRSGLPLAQLKATLTAGGSPVVGVPVEFRIGTTLVCTSTTDAAGVARCNALPQLLQLTLSLGYTASYAGDANRLPAQNFGGIIK